MYNKFSTNLRSGIIQWIGDIIFVPCDNSNTMWLLIDLEKNEYRAFYSFNRLRNEIGLHKSFDKPALPTRIGSKYEIRQVELDDRI